MPSHDYHDFRASLGRLPTDERVQHALREYLAPLLDDLAGTLRELSSLSWDDRVQTLWELIAADNFACWQRLGRSGSVYKFAIDLVQSVQGLRKTRHDRQQGNWSQLLDGSTDRDTWITALRESGLGAKQVVKLVEYSVVLRDHARQQPMWSRRALDIRGLVDLISGTAPNLSPDLTHKANYVNERLAETKLDQLGFARFVLLLEKPIVSEAAVYQIAHRWKERMGYL